jgi:hypothetical protein
MDVFIPRWVAISPLQGALVPAVIGPGFGTRESYSRPCPYPLGWFVKCTLTA